MRKLLQICFVTLMTTLMCSFSQPEAQVVSVEEIVEPIELVEETVEVKMERILASPETFTVEIHTAVLEKEEPTIVMSEEDINLIALLTMAEAEGESEYGKRLVIDTVLNRVDSEKYPDSVHDVIYQKGQFTSMWNGRVDRCYVTEEICQLVREELESRTNYDTIFFHAGKYSKYGTPMFAEGNHYFSSI